MTNEGMEEGRNIFGCCAHPCFRFLFLDFRTREDAILEGFLTLVDIQVSHASLQGRTQYAG